MKKKQSEEMSAVRQRRYDKAEVDLSPSNSIPRDTEFDLRPAMSRTHSGFDECSFVADKPGNALWTEKNRP